MQFSNLLATIESKPGICTVDIPDAWSQGRSVFGGLQVVLATRAMRTLVPAHIPIRTLQATFVGPVSPGHVRAVAKILRTGKNTIQVESRIMRDEETLCLVVGVFGEARTSSIFIMPDKERVLETIQGNSIPTLPGITPNFLQHFEALWIRGGTPLSGTGEQKVTIKLDFNDSGVVSEDHVIALADFMPPIAMHYFTLPMNASSMNWMLEFLCDDFSGIGLNDWQIDGEIQAARDGYASESTIIWSPNGAAIALSRQTRAIFA